MTNHTIDDVQDYLTFISDNRVKTIMDVRSLIEKHPSNKIVSLLENLAKRKEEILMELIEEDKTSSIINETIATVFRLNMAIETIQKSNALKQEVKPT